MPIVETVKGSILNAPQMYIAHGVNCQNRMGSGVAKVLFGKYPIVKSSYHKFIKSCEFLLINGQEDLLGMVELILVDEKKHVLNCFTQEFYGYDKKKYVSYEAIKKCFTEIDGDNSIDEVAIPKIGCGLAGGDWEAVSIIIDLCTPNTKITVYEV
jgi:O-acetyl-ADP-ribose deacetylase (regulator of RNase III)